MSIRMFCIAVAMLALFVACHPQIDESDLAYEQKSGYSDPYIPTSLDSLVFRSLGSAHPQVLLDSFFGLWEKESKQTDTVQFQIMDDTLRALYSLFADYYRSDSGQHDGRLVVLPDSLWICVLDSFRFERAGRDLSKTDPLLGRGDFGNSIAFTPIFIGARGVVHLNDKFLHSLNYYVNERDGRTPCLLGRIDEFKLHDLEAKKKILQRYIQVEPQHSCKGLGFLTFPCVYAVAFTRDMAKVRFSYEDSYSSGGAVEYVLTDRGWVRTQYLVRWIQ